MTAKWLENGVRAYPELQLLWGVPHLQRSVKVVNGRQHHGWLIDACWERWLAHVVPSNMRANVTEIDSKVSEYIMHQFVMYAADRSGCPCWPLYITESTNNGPMSIWTGLHTNGKRWPSLMNQVFFYIMWMIRCAYLGDTRHQDAQLEDSKPVEKLWCFGRCSAGKLWVQPSMWMLLWHIPSTLGCDLFQQGNVLCHKEHNVI